MRIGMRKPSVKRMIKARTTGRAKRAVKKAVIPGYGKRGMGFVKNPKRSVKGAIYRRTTFSVWDLFREITCLEHRSCRALPSPIPHPACFCSRRTRPKIDTCIVLYGYETIWLWSLNMRFLDYCQSSR